MCAGGGQVPFPLEGAGDPCPQGSTREPKPGLTGTAEALARRAETERADRRSLPWLRRARHLALPERLACGWRLLEFTSGWDAVCPGHSALPDHRFSLQLTRTRASLTSLCDPGAIPREEPSFLPVFIVPTESSSEATSSHLPSRMSSSRCHLPLQQRPLSWVLWIRKHFCLETLSLGLPTATPFLRHHSARLRRGADWIPLPLLPSLRPRRVHHPPPTPPRSLRPPRCSHAGPPEPAAIPLSPSP